MELELRTSLFEVETHFEILRLQRQDRGGEGLVRILVDEPLLNKPDYIAMCVNHAGFIEDQGWKPGALGEWQVTKAEGFD